MDEQNRKQKGKASTSWVRTGAEWVRSRFESPKSDQHSTHLSLGGRPKNSIPSTPSGTSLTLTPSTPGISSPAATSPVLSLTQGDPSASGEGSSPWELGLAIANKKLLGHGLPPLYNTSGQLASEIIESTVGSLQATINDANQNQNSKKAAAGRRMREILQTFDKYAKVVDTAVQHQPEITALVWAGVRATLQIALNHIETTDSLEVAIAMIAEKMAVCEFFASVYAEARALGDNLQQALRLALPEFYASILVFSMKARQYFDPLTSKVTKLKYALKPFSIEFQPFIDEILENERRVRDCADVATMETIKTNSVKLSQIHSHLMDIQSKLIPLTKLDDIMDFIAENVKMTKEILDRQKEMYLSAARAEDGRIQKLLQILTPLESLKRHQDVRSSRLDGTGTWLLQDPRFLLWRDCPTSDTILCCYGHPGAGKTVISSIVIDNLSQFFQQDNVGIAVIYCDYRDQASQTVVNILGSLLQQFLLAASCVPDEVKIKLESICKHGKKVEIGDISQMFKVALVQFQRTFVCIDALDELEPRVRFSLLTLLRDEFSTVKVFLTGRPVVQQDVNSRLEIADAIDIIPKPEDIRAYLEHEMKVDSDINPDAMNSVLKREILDTITTSSKGMFLLPTLHIRMVLKHKTIAARRKALKTLPETLGDAFSDMLDRILKLPKEEDLGKRTLLLLHLAYRPLKLEELRHALAVELGNTELDEDNIPSRKAILDCCLGLVIVDEETMTVRFVHYTLEEHFKEHGSKYFPDRHSTLAEICLTYLNYGRISRHCPTIDDLKQRQTEFSFLEYAACHWGHYARQQKKHSTTQLALKLLSQQSREASCAMQVLYFIVLRPWYSWSSPHTLLLTGLHVAAYFGLEEYMAMLVGKIQNWDPMEEEQRTPISYAARYGHEAVVRLLIEQGADADSKDWDGQSPLSYAALYGYEAVARLLLGQGVDADSKDNNDRSPLSHAAQHGHEAVVRLLLEQGADADSKDSGGQSPLSYAAVYGYEAVVTQLLERGVDANPNVKHGRSPLSYASQYGHEAVVRLLLERGVDPDSRSSGGRSPLSYAAADGCEAVVRLLLERSVDADSKSTAHGRSPLIYAALCGNETIVKLLLERGVDADLKDSRGRSPLSYATRYGYEAVVRLLLERGVDADSKDINGQSPLSYAAENGREAIVRLFLERNVDADSKDFNGRSPLSYAAQFGHEAVVRLLFERSVNADSKDSNCRSPLSYAAEDGNGAIVRMLLERGADVNSIDSVGWSPLTYAVQQRHKAVVQLLQQYLNSLPTSS